MRIVFDELVVDPAQQRLPYVRRNTASKQLRIAYAATSNFAAVATSSNASS